MANFTLFMTAVMTALLFCACISRQVMTQRERYGALAIALFWYLASADSLIHADIAAWQYAGYAIVLLALTVGGSTFLYMRHWPARMRKSLLFTRGELYIGHDGNLYRRSFKDGKPDYTCIATYPK